MGLEELAQQKEAYSTASKFKRAHIISAYSWALNLKPCSPGERVSLPCLSSSLLSGSELHRGRWEDLGRDPKTQNEVAHGPQAGSALLESGLAETSEAESLVNHSPGQGLCSSPPPLPTTGSQGAAPGRGTLDCWFKSGGHCPFGCRYLNFYKRTMDFLLRNKIISSKEVTLPIVSAAISHLWQTFSEERKTIILQAWERTQKGLVGSCPEPACPEGSVKDSGVDSQGASCSLVSTPEEVSQPTGEKGWIEMTPSPVPGDARGS